MEQQLITLEQKITQLEHQMDQLSAANTQKNMDIHRLHLQLMALAQSIESLKGMVQQGSAENSNPPPPHY